MFVKNLVLVIGCLGVVQAVLICLYLFVTSFNLAFKAETGITPSQYRNQFSVA